MLRQQRTSGKPRNRYLYDWNSFISEGCSFLLEWYSWWAYCNLRAGWSLGPVQSRYILEGEGGDQVCGRAATGLPVIDISFANLPPHFIKGDSGLTASEWDDILPGYSTFYPKSFR